MPLLKNRKDNNRVFGEKKENWSKLGVFLNNLPGMVFCCCNNRERTMVFVSEGCYDLTGYRPSDLVNNRKVAYGRLIHEDDRRSVRKEMGAAIRENRPFRIQYRILTARGKTKWVLELGYGSTVPEEEFGKVNGFIIDFTECWQTRKELQMIKGKLEEANNALIDQRKELKRSIKELSFLFDVSRKISSTLNLSEILDSVLDLLMERFKAYAWSIRILDDDGYLRIKSQRRLSPEFVRLAERKPTMDSYSGECFLKNKIIIVKDAERVNKPISTNLRVKAGIKSFALVPIATEDEVLGVLAGACKKEKGHFSEEYSEFMQTLCHQLALAVRNARLYEEVKNFGNELENELEKRTQELQEKSRLLAQSEKLAALGEMAERVAHETRNPLVSIGGFARRIQRELPSHDPLRKYIDIVIDGVERLERMVYSITEYKKYICVDL